MHRLPRRTSLVAETASTLKQWIAAKELSERLPGELRLKSLLGVGRNTLRLALKVLEEQRWISSPGQGHQRLVRKRNLPTGQPAADRRLPVTFLSPFPTVDRILLLEMEELQMHLADQGRELRFVAPKIFHLQRPERHLARLVKENPSAAWVLHFVSEATQQWFQQQRIPAFVYGSPYPQVNLPYVVNDWESASFHAGLQLVRQKHRMIGLLGFATPVPGVLAVERGLRRALATARPPAQLLVLSENTSPPAVAKSLEMAFRLERRPTALVFSSSSHLLTCLSWLISKGIAVPADVSLVCVPSDSWFQELYPPVCHYENNPHQFAHHVRKRVMELVETGRVTGPSILVLLEYVAGATIGPAPRPPKPMTALSRQLV
jgi:DNA-binding LacI/PurR family transcriptional regulator